MNRELVAAKKALSSDNAKASGKKVVRRKRTPKVKPEPVLREPVVVEEPPRQAPKREVYPTWTCKCNKAHVMTPKTVGIVCFRCKTVADVKGGKVTHVRELEG